MDKYDGDNMEYIISAELQPGEQKLVLITHDETCFDSNDSKRSIWLEGESHALRPKGSGRSLMVSQFLCQCHGQMEVTVTEAMAAEFPALQGLVGSKYETLKIIKPGKNADGYWTNKDLVQQTKVAQVLFKILHPGCVAVNAFDNSQNHNAMAPDALVASRLNLSDGGAHVPQLRDGWFIKDGVRIIQPMQFDFPGGRIQKGVRRILQERGLWPSRGLSLKDARALLAEQADFASQQSWISETVAGFGHKIILYPKFHPEFNFIEMFWGEKKIYTQALLL